MSEAGKVKSLLALGPLEEPVDPPRDCAFSTREEERGSDGERRHQVLLEAIRSLDGRNKWKLSERSEASLHMSEFNVSSEGTREKLVLSDLLQPTEASSSLATVMKQLKRVKSKRTLDLPLSKAAVAQMHREVASTRVSQDLSKWEPVVLKNRKAEQLVFPLQKEQAASAPIEHVLSGWKVARTPLEQAVLNVLHKNKQPVTDPLLTPAEKAALQAMSLEEARMRRAELQRARALQSYYEAKARRKKKIKSKKYHQITKKAKARKALKDYAMLQKVSPAAALEVLDRVGEARILERMNLKHENSGRWARSRATLAKCNPAARRAVQEQLAMNKELTQKLQAASESEEEEGGVEDRRPVPDVTSEVQMNTSGSNPWMHRSYTNDVREAGMQKDPEQLPEPATQEDLDSKEGEHQVAAEETLLKEFEKQSLRKRARTEQGAKPVRSQKRAQHLGSQATSGFRTVSQNLGKEDLQDRKQKPNSVGGVLPTQKEEEEEVPLLLQRPERLQTSEESAGEGCFQNTQLPRPELPVPRTEKQQPGALKEKNKQPMIDLQNLLSAKSSGRSLPVPTTVEDSEGVGERDQNQMIKEAFAGDDVIRDFLKEKREAVEASKPENMSLTLPGWGDWGGVGLQPRTKKRRRFLMKAPEGPPRRDRNLPNVIINEKRNIHAAAHQVHTLPFPFTHPQQFERTIQTPVGSTWNTQRAFQKLTAPKVVTKPGHIIKPLQPEDVGYRSSSRWGLPVPQRDLKPPRRNSECRRRDSLMP